MLLTRLYLQEVVSLELFIVLLVLSSKEGAERLAVAQLERHVSQTHITYYVNT
jgi:hypothetical protein